MSHCERCTIVVLLLTLTTVIGACSGREESRAKKFLVDYDQTVEMDGQILDQQASAERVAWALLMSLRQDARAGGDTQAREQAWKTQCRLAHHEVIRSNAAKVIAQRRADPEQFTFDVITGWTPIVAYYSRYFDPDFDTAGTRMQTTGSKLGGIGPDKSAVDIKEVHYILPSASRGGPDGLQIGVTIRVSLAKTAGGYWRVYRVGYGQSPDLQRLQDQE